MNQSRPLKVYLTVALGLLLIRLSSSAIVWPLNTHTTDDWNYVATANYLDETGDYDYAMSGRQYLAINLLIWHWVFPGQYQTLYFMQLVMVWITSVLLFYLIHRLRPEYSWFGFLLAAVYLVYHPADVDSVISWLVLGSWVLVWIAISLVLLMEFYKQVDHRRAWGLLLISCLMIYVATNMFEGAAFMVGLVPLVILGLERRWSRKIGIGFAAWYLALGLAFIEFFVSTFVNEDPTYQANSKPDEFSLTTLIKDTVQYYKAAFPIGRILHTPYHEILTAILVCGAFLVVTFIFWRRFPGFSSLPVPRDALLLLLLGLILLPLGGAGYIYVRIIGGRDLMLSAHAQAIVVSSILILLAYGLSRLLRLSQRRVLLGLSIPFFFLSAQWYYIAQMKWGDLPAFDDKTTFLRSMVALLPALEEDTLVITEGCLRADYIPFWVTVRNPKYIGYLYGEASITGIAMTNVENVEFDAEGILFTGDAGRTAFIEKRYVYEQMVLLRCERERVFISEKFSQLPGVPEDVDRRYNPYARIRDEFLPARRSLILAR